MESLDKSLVDPIQTFVKSDVREARYFNHEFLKAQVEYEGNIGKLNQLKQKGKTDQKKVEAATTVLLVSQQKYDTVRSASIFSSMHSLLTVFSYRWPRRV